MNGSTDESLSQNLAHDKYNEAEAQPIAPHRYGVLMYAFAISILVSVLCSVYFLPRYYKSAVIYHTAEISFQINQINNAINQLNIALLCAPSSKKIKILLAKSYFKSGSYQNGVLAFRLLKGLSLDKSEVADLKSVIPVKYN